MRLDLDRAAQPEGGLQPVCGFSQEDYAQLLADLLPRGGAWPRERESVLMQTFAALAVEYWRVHGRDCDLLDESYPGTAFETIDDWERVCGLPDPCIEPPLTDLVLRRLAVLAKLAARGGQSRAYYKAVAQALGYYIKIDEFRQFRAGRGTAGEPVNGYDWIFAWRITAPQTYAGVFRAGENAAGDRLRVWGNKLLECVMEQLKPAHTILQFAYRPEGSVWDADDPRGESIWDGGESLWDVATFSEQES